MSFETKTFKKIFIHILALKTVDTQMLFWSIFFSSTKKVDNRQKQPKWCF